LRPAGVNNSQDHIPKITRAKWTGGVAQVVESLLCKCKALSSNSSLIKKKKKERKKGRREREGRKTKGREGKGLAPHVLTSRHLWP
jgi:hypothetical protein